MIFRKQYIFIIAPLILGIGLFLVLSNTTEAQSTPDNACNIWVKTGTAKQCRDPQTSGETTLQTQDVLKCMPLRDVDTAVSCGDLVSDRSGVRAFRTCTKEGSTDRTEWVDYKTCPCGCDNPVGGASCKCCEESYRICTDDGNIEEGWKNTNTCQWSKPRIIQCEYGCHTVNDRAECRAEPEPVIKWESCLCASNKKPITTLGVREGSTVVVEGIYKNKDYAGQDFSVACGEIQEVEVDGKCKVEELVPPCPLKGYCHRKRVCYASGATLHYGKCSGQDSNSYTCRQAEIITEPGRRLKYQGKWYENCACSPDIPPTLTCPVDPPTCKQGETECKARNGTINCCQQGEVCNSGVCKSFIPPPLLCPQGETRCGNECCSSDQVCDAGVCKDDPPKAFIVAVSGQCEAVKIGWGGGSAPYTVYIDNVEIYTTRNKVNRRSEYSTTLSPGTHSIRVIDNSTPPQIRATTYTAQKCETEPPPTTFPEPFAPVLKEVPPVF